MVNDTTERRTETSRLFDLEVFIGRLLALGNAVSTTLLAAGLAVWVGTGSEDTVAMYLLHAGLITVMCTPIARVLVSFGVFLRDRQWYFASTTLGVLLVLAAAAMVAARR
jgi:uncharacterized membrane protein